MAKTIWSERFSMKVVLDTMRGLEGKGSQSFITSCGEAWRGGKIDGRICYVLYATGWLDRQLPTGHYCTRPDTALKAHRFSVKHLWRTAPMTGRMIAREFGEAAEGVPSSL